MIIGLSLIQVGLTSIGGGYAAMADHTFGAPKNLLLAGIVLALIIISASVTRTHRFAGDRHGGRLSGGMVARYAAGQYRADQSSLITVPRRCTTVWASTGACCCR
jgi:hypothetical protein